MTSPGDKNKIKQIIPAPEGLELHMFFKDNSLERCRDRVLCLAVINDSEDGDRIIPICKCDIERGFDGQFHVDCLTEKYAVVLIDTKDPTDETE